MAITSSLSPAEAASIRGEFQNLDATIGELQDHPQVTFERSDGTTIGPVTCSSIKRDGLQDRSSGSGTGYSGVELTGTLKALATEFPEPVQPGDRFVWGDQVCRVAVGPAPKWYGGTVVIEFVLEVGN